MIPIEKYKAAVEFLRKVYQGQRAGWSTPPELDIRMRYDGSAALESYEEANNAAQVRYASSLRKANDLDYLNDAIEWEIQAAKERLEETERDIWAHYVECIIEDFDVLTQAEQFDYMMICHPRDILSGL